MTIVADENAIHVLCSRCNYRESIDTSEVPYKADRIDFAIGSLKEKGWIDYQCAIYCPNCVKRAGNSATVTEITVEGGDIWVKLNISADDFAEKLMSGWERKTFKIKEDEK